QARLSDHPGGDPDLLRRLRAGEPRRRPLLHAARSEDPLLSTLTEPVPVTSRPRGLQWRRFARRNPTIVAGGVILAIVALLAIAAPLFAGDTLTMHPAMRLRPPPEKGWVGTDHLGPRGFAGTIFGAPGSLVVRLSV